METIESVIFDWGGVLIDDPAPGLVQYCAEALGVSREDYTGAHDKFAEGFQKGLVSERGFWAEVCGDLGVPEPRVRSLWGEAFRWAYAPREAVFSMASALQREGYKTALLSNTEVPAMEYFLELGYDMFDAAVFSCAEGTRKPERRIYELTLERLGSKPGRAVFVDDRADYIEGARQAGLKTILFEDIKRVKEKLAVLSVRLD
ncbi:MAG: HAD family phosphatase [Phycisphaerales bacterium]|nr:MAG: HAD family phosphatase [Phycisphaerales bacterium]